LGEALEMDPAAISLDAKFWSAIIVGIIGAIGAVIGAAVTLIVSHRQRKTLIATVHEQTSTQINIAEKQIITQIDLAGRQISAQIQTAHQQINAQIASKEAELTQTQFKDILAKRIEVYPKLWNIAQTFLSDRSREGRLKDPNWEPDAELAREFLKSLMAWHQENGVFLSEPSYRTFTRLRTEAFELVQRCNLEGYQPTRKNIQHLDELFTNVQDPIPNTDPRSLALSAWLKNDLGSFQTPGSRIRKGYRGNRC
jgi:gas vesicle protein